MRKIKFKGSFKVQDDGYYSEEEKNYIESKQHEILSINIGSHCTIAYKESVITVFEMRCSNYDLLQFTGLLSKNHKANLQPEIYEDDIFRHTKETDSGEDITAYSVVMWIEQLAAFYLVPIEHYDVIKGNDVSEEKEFSWLFEDAELRDFSIDIGLIKVGNIHDNPELVQK